MFIKAKPFGHWPGRRQAGWRVGRNLPNQIATSRKFVNNEDPRRCSHNPGVSRFTIKKTCDKNSGNQTSPTVLKRCTNTVQLSQPMSESEAALSAQTLVKRPPPAVISRDNILGSIESLAGPSALVFSLWALALYYFDGDLPPPVLILSVLVFALTFPGTSHLRSSRGRALVDIAFNWVWLAGLMFALGIATGYIR